MCYFCPFSYINLEILWSVPSKYIYIYTIILLLQRERTQKWCFIDTKIKIKLNSEMRKKIFFGGWKKEKLTYGNILRVFSYKQNITHHSCIIWNLLTVLIYIDTSTSKTISMKDITRLNCFYKLMYLLAFIISIKCIAIKEIVQKKYIKNIKY